MACVSKNKGGIVGRKLIFLTLVIAFSVSLVGCATRLIDFTFISTKNIDLTKGASFKRGPSRVEGIDSVSIIIIIPTGQANIKEAIDRAIESVPEAVALLDGVVTSKSWYIPYIYGKASFVVEGTPLIDPSLVTAKLKSNYIISRLDKKGNVVKMEYANKIEYDSFKRKIGI